MKIDDKEILYEYYELKKVTVVKPNCGYALVNASVGSCRICGNMITGMGGQHNMVCTTCGDKVLSDRLKLNN